MSEECALKCGLFTDSLLEVGDLAALQVRQVHARSVIYQYYNTLCRYEYEV